MWSTGLVGSSPSDPFDEKWDTWCDSWLVSFLFSDDGPARLEIWRRQAKQGNFDGFTFSCSTSTKCLALNPLFDLYVCIFTCGAFPLCLSLYIYIEMHYICLSRYYLNFISIIISNGFNFKAAVMFFYKCSHQVPIRVQWAPAQ